jgi:hypothetical protein
VTTRTQLTTHTLDVPGATLTYDVRPNDASTKPILVLIGAPMGAAGKRDAFAAKLREVLAARAARGT